MCVCVFVSPQNAGFPSGLLSVRFFDPRNDSTAIVKVNTMGWNRWYPTPTLLPDGLVMIMGGTQVRHPMCVCV